MDWQINKTLQPRLVDSWLLFLAFRLAINLGNGGHRKKSQGLPLLGLSVAVAILVVVLSVVNGFEVEMRERVLNLFPHVLIYHPEQTSLVPEQQQLIQAHPQVQAVAPLIEIGSMLVANGAHQGALISAVDVDKEHTVNALPKYLEQGAWPRLNKEPFAIILSKRTAEKLRLSVDDQVTVVLPRTQMSMIGISVRSKRFKVVGIFETSTDLDQSFAYIRLEDGRKLAGASYPEGVRLKVTDLFEASAILQSIYYSSFEHPITGSTWMNRQGNLYAAIGLQKKIMAILLALLIAVAAFNITSQLVIFVEEHRSDIAILKTLGASNNQLRALFVLQGLALGIAGTALGLLIGYVSCDLLQWSIGQISIVFGIELLEPYFVHFLPIERLIQDFLWISLMSLFFCFLASLYPSHRASQMIITEGLMHE